MISKDNSYISLSNENSRRKILLFFLSTTALFPTRRSSAKTKNKNPYDERRLLEQNKRRQKENNAPDDFPSFVREGMYQAAIPWFNWGIFNFKALPSKCNSDVFPENNRVK